MIRLMFVHYTLSSVWVAAWPPFEKKKAAHLIGHVFSLYFGLFVFLITCIIILLLIAPVPVYCCSSTYIIHSLYCDCSANKQTTSICILPLFDDNTAF